MSQAKISDYQLHITPIFEESSLIYVVLDDLYRNIAIPELFCIVILALGLENQPKSVGGRPRFETYVHGCTDTRKCLEAVG